MKKFLFVGLIGAVFFSSVFLNVVKAQSVSTANDPALKIYRAVPPKVNDLVNTKLDIRFDYQKRFLIGKEWVTLKPHFYPTDTVTLDAKGMDIKTIAIVKNGINISLKFRYNNNNKLVIQLGKIYKNDELYTLYIAYTAKPDQAPKDPADTIEKGLFFINPDSTVKGKPVQIWTHGETQNSSFWFPTIDEPNQKTTEEISMTVPDKYVTLSNGRLILQHKWTDGTRTDTWKMDLPHSPYLFMLAVGNFRIYHDKWHNKQVDYYLEPKYAPYAKDIFGFTPDAMEFYSKTLGIDYPWNKYSQIVVRDFVSGATENTTATVLGDYVQMTKRELLDAYFDEGRASIVHELFHQWFGDDVTAKSWSNITLNESFARFSETMWAEHEYGQDAGDAHINTNRLNYIYSPGASTENLVRFDYKNTREVFDVVSYEKGAAILYMLRNYLGNAAFYKGLGIYLRTYAFKNADAQQLRLCLEEASGLDLNWFFNQWYFGSGHPQLQIDYKWDPATKTQTIYLQQTQPDKIFTLPMAIDIYASGKVLRHQVWMRGRTDTLTFHSDESPDLVNVDADKALLVEKKDRKTFANFVFQYFNAPLYLDRKEALDAASAMQTDKQALRVMVAALNDKYYGLRLRAIQKLKLDSASVISVALPELRKLAQNDNNTLVRAAALIALSQLHNSGDLLMFRNALTSQSYAIQGAGLEGIASLNPSEAFQDAKSLEKDNAGALTASIIKVYAADGNDREWTFVDEKFVNMTVSDKFSSLKNYAAMVGRVHNPKFAQDGITQMKNLGIAQRNSGVVPYLIDMLKTIEKQRTTMNDNSSSVLAINAIEALK